MTTQMTVEGEIEIAEAAGRPEGSDGIGIGIAGVAIGVASIMAVYGEIFVDALAILSVITVVGVLAIRSGSKKLRWVTAALMTIFVGVNAMYAVADLSHPESPGAFIATTVVVLCGLTTVVLAALSAQGRVVPVRRVWMGVGALIAVAGAGSLASAASIDNDSAEPGDVTVAAVDLEYPEEVVVSPQSSGLLVANRDSYRHDFVVEGQMEAVELPANTDVRIAVDGLEPGVYRFYCSIAGHENMEGQLIVQ